VLVLSLSQHPHVVTARLNYWRRRFEMLQALFA